MRSSSDAAFYLLVIAGFLLPFLLLLVFNYSLSVSSITGAFVLCAVFSYAAFWGFSMRNGLAAPLYRRHALWVGRPALTLRCNGCCWHCLPRSIPTGALHRLA